MGDDWLIGWKAIAAYLHVSVRTAKNYYYHAGLPVRRPAGMEVRAPVEAVRVWHEKYSAEAAHCR